MCYKKSINKQKGTSNYFVSVWLIATRNSQDIFFCERMRRTQISESFNNLSHSSVTYAIGFED